jgi:hypothetical protein
MLRSEVRFFLAPLTPVRAVGGNVLKAVRRTLVALSAAGVIAGFLRVRFGGETPRQQGGWRELSGPDLR